MRKLFYKWVNLPDNEDYETGKGHVWHGSLFLVGLILSFIILIIVL